MRIAVIAGYSPALTNFHGPLLAAMRARGHEVTALAPDDSPAARDALRRMGVSFVPVSLSRAGLNPLADLAFLRELTGWLRRLAPDASLSLMVKPVIWGSLAASLARVPAIYALIPGLGRAFGLEGERLPLGRRLLNRLVRGLYRLALPRCRGVLFLNPDDRDLFRNLGLLRPEQASIVVPGAGVDLTRFSPAEPVLPDPVEGGPVFLTMTRLLLDKGLPEFAEAARTLKARYPAAEFRVLGAPEPGPGGVPAERLRAWAEEGAVRVLEPVADVRPELRRASVCVLASAYREGLPRSLLEAMSMARPIIASDTPGCRETVIPRRNGFLVPPRDPQALARAMERFILDPELIAEMGAESRLLAERRFGSEQVDAQILDFLGLA
ncbi:glycosyltransferase family 4 protein [Desulfovibrio sp.]